MAEVPVPVVGKYRLLRKLAKGGMAEVYLAQADGPAGFSKTLVLKRILPHLAEDSGFVEMFLNEARLAALLNHPNIVQIFDLGERDGSYFIAMEYIDGPSLRALVKRANAMGRLIPPEHAAKIISLACDGLGYAHDFADNGRPLGLIHRDISPDNILLSRAGSVKVVDFGIAKAANQPHLTQTGTIKGKIAYMPPEQLRGLPLDRRADIFALGIVLYELLAGMKPFDSTSEVATMQSILNDQPAPLPARRPDCPGELWAIIERALSKNRDHRYPDCRSMQRDLEQFLIQRGKPLGAYELAQLVGEIGSPPAAAPDAAEAARPGSTPPPAPVSALITRAVPPQALPLDPEAAGPVSGLVTKHVPVQAQAAGFAGVSPDAASGPATKQVPAQAFTPDPSGAASDPVTKQVPAQAYVPDSLVAAGQSGGPSTKVVGPPPGVSAPARSPGHLEPAVAERPGAREAVTSSAPAAAGRAPARRGKTAGVLALVGVLAVAAGVAAVWFINRAPASADPAPRQDPPARADASPAASAPPVVVAPPPVVTAPAQPVETPAATAEEPQGEPPAADPKPVVAQVDPVPTAVAKTLPKKPTRPTAKPEPKTAVPAVAAAKTELVIKTEPPCSVTVDGVPAGMSPARVSGLAPGAHQVTLVNKAEGLNRRLTVEVVAGKTTTETVKFGTGTLVFRVRPWAEVQVDGRPRGTTPLPSGLTVYEGEHRVRLYNPELGKEQIRVVWVEPGEEKVVKVDMLR